jgi:hypothetical protein
MIAIKDNVLSQADLAIIQELYFCNKPNYDTSWINKSDIPAWFNAIVNEASKFFSTESHVGVEWWTQNNGSLPSKGWHYDLDERLWQEQHKISTPICSIIFYPLIENLQGGQFKTESCIITPQTNRMIVMAPGTLHTVSEYTGTRWSLLINPWNYAIVV